ncbi:MAG: Gfo/Idh/MocA family oxidoreductase [Planctomycetota bacterium]|nr:Gfo/Idh/MocA family oxidoreductase [Planctomycetota bacterium]
MSESKVRCAVIGVGRMGRHHARVYAQHKEVDFAGVVDVNADAAKSITEEWGGVAFGDLQELIDKGVDAVTIATPTVHHKTAAESLLQAKIACLIEKPLAPNAAEARTIADAAEANDVVLQVGHIVRYDPVMRAIAALDGITPRFIEMDRVSPMTFRSVDVGVVLDMMIHDLDLLQMLMGVEPEEVDANAVCVLGEAEDVCNARLTFPAMAGGDGMRSVANVTASRLALKTERKLRIISEDAYVSADFVARSGRVVRKKANEEQLVELRARLKAGEDLSNLNYLELIEIEELDVQPGDALEMQIDDFLDAVREDRRPTIDAQAGFAAVRTAERIVESARAAGARMV